jgi:hypothetical protein
VRLAEVMAYADIPAAMRPTLSDLVSGQQPLGQLGLPVCDRGKHAQALRDALQGASKQLQQATSGGWHQGGRTCQLLDALPRASWIRCRRCCLT